MSEEQQIITQGQVITEAPLEVTGYMAEQDIDQERHRAGRLEALDEVIKSLEAPQNS